MADMSWSGVERTGKLYLLSGTEKQTKKEKKEKGRDRQDKTRLCLAEGCCLGVGKGHWFGFRGGWVGGVSLLVNLPWHLFNVHGTFLVYHGT